MYRNLIWGPFADIYVHKSSFNYYNRRDGDGAAAAAASATAEHLPTEFVIPRHFTVTVLHGTHIFMDDGVSIKGETCNSAVSSTCDE